jgi:3-phenylpropionate/cinnamic acid dioxygenase small subunit
VTLRLGKDLTVENWTVRAERFLAFEAFLLDQRRFEEWVDLFGDDGIYWIPLDRAADDAGESLNIAYEGPSRLRQRVARLRSGIAHAQEPPSSTVHSYGSVFVEAASDKGATVRSSLLVVESRFGPHALVAARCEHRLAYDTSGTITIEMKRVDLVDAAQAQHDLSFIC